MEDSELKKKLEDGLNGVKILSDTICNLEKEVLALEELLNDIKDLEWYKCNVFGCKASFWNHGAANNGGYLNCEMLYPNTTCWEENTKWYCKDHYHPSCKVKIGEYLPEDFYY